MTTRVFVLSQRSMFYEGIETLLAERGGFEIVGHCADSKRAIDCIQKKHPDVIILNLDDPETDLSKPVLCVFRERRNLRIIGLSLMDNKMCIYRGENVEVRQIEDLFNAVQD